MYMRSMGMKRLRLLADIDPSREGVTHHTCRYCHRPYRTISWAHLVYSHRFDRETAIADYVRRFRLKSNWSLAAINKGRRSTIRRYESAGRRWTRERAISEIRRLRKLGVPLHSGQIRRTHRILFRNAQRLFGTWDRVLAGAGIRPDLVRRRTHRTSDEILAILRRDARAGKDVSYKGLKDRDSRLCHVIMKYFGGVANALRKAGIKPESEVRHRRWSRAMIMREIASIDWQSLDRRDLSYQRLQKAAVAHFGGWKKALRRVGLEEWAWRPIRRRN